MPKCNEISTAQLMRLIGISGCPTLLETFHLDTQPLQTMAKLIRAADLGQPGDAPEAAGLLALSVGLSRLHRDDTAQLEAGMTLYDALYAWARDGQGETHASELSA